ncbi:hypothetical protein [Burkholderia seminalis]|uniref:hypothetical protein n=1 Tax=Burkholderia seminalis TaxID=488731 RepID=UPI001452E1A6|nr:hypothetical protein [Burkholderia seminalis]MBJ9590905.1 hypothetical protein [Burkholderia seminalis]MCA8431180.1 hypothetical protein [Burkholderia seminalis]VWB65163.1 hypothetical protein BSE24067_03050 [Burkholderia seminalis]
MTKQNTIALIVDPGSGERIRDVAAHARHTWVVTSDINDTVVKRIWNTSAALPGQAAEGGVTTFLRHGDDRESWCAGILDTLDDHHNGATHGYAMLAVFGTTLSERLRLALMALGFSGFASTDDGFSAVKPDTA